MIAAHGASISIDQQGVHIEYSRLSAALQGLAGPADDITIGATRTVALSDIDDVSATSPTSLLPGEVRLHGIDLAVEFAPNQQANLQQAVDAIKRALAGDAPVAGIPGLNGVAMSVATANASWASVCQVQVAELVDATITRTATFSWLPSAEHAEPDAEVLALAGLEALPSTDPAEQVIPKLLDFIGDKPLVAHNAYFHISALRESLQAAGNFDISGLFGCTLALSRATDVSARSQTVADVAEALQVQVDPADRAAATAEVLVALARKTGHSGSLMEIFHAAGLTLGEAKDSSIIPVLKDRSGAARALQSQGSTVAAAASGGAGTDFRETKPADPAPAAAGDSEAEEQPRRGPAPWQSVATPDEIPEPNQAADPTNPLFGQHVTLTGEFEPFSKGQLWSGIADLGGQVGKNVTKKTTVLVIGEWARKTSNEKKAEEYRDAGQEIAFWSADQLLDVLGLNEEPPF